MEKVNKNINRDKTNQEDIEKNFHKDCVGALCKVLNYDNKIYFVGEIEEYDVNNHEVKIIPYRDESACVITASDVPVKLHIQKGDQITVLYGVTKRQSSNCWWITLDNIVEYNEQREVFRQVVHGTATVKKLENQESEEIACDLVDISLMGLCFCCKEEFKVGEKMIITTSTLYPNASNSYTFECVVRRVFERTKKDEIQDEKQEQISDRKYYGCAFVNLSPSIRKNLSKDILFLQSQERKFEF